VTQLLEAPEGLSLGGEKRELTILMSDLRGFTAMSEQLAAEEVVRIINIYLGEMTEIILEHQGTIDEFLGDAILAFFGAPIRREDDVARALACAVAMQQAMQRVNGQIAALGFSEVSMGIGLHTGPLVVGNIGSERRSKYGAVGHNINLASRIESFSVGGQILASRQTVEACDAELRIDRELTVSPKGVREPITLYEVGGVGAPYERYLPERGTRELRALPQPISARFKVVDGKQCGDDALEATLWRLTGDEAEVRAPLALDPMTNLRISLYEEGGDAHRRGSLRQGDPPGLGITSGPEGQVHLLARGRAAAAAGAAAAHIVPRRGSVVVRAAAKEPAQPLPEGPLRLEQRADGRALHALAGALHGAREGAAQGGAGLAQRGPSAHRDAGGAEHPLDRHQILTRQPLGADVGDPGEEDRCGAVTDDGRRLVVEPAEGVCRALARRTDAIASALAPRLPRWLRLALTDDGYAGRPRCASQGEVRGQDHGQAQ
jgi:class 3 adenylate cyclase